MSRSRPMGQLQRHWTSVANRGRPISVYFSEHKITLNPSIKCISQSTTRQKYLYRVARARCKWQAVADAKASREPRSCIQAVERQQQKTTTRQSILCTLEIGLNFLLTTITKQTLNESMVCAEVWYDMWGGGGNSPYNTSPTKHPQVKMRGGVGGRGKGGAQP